MLAYSASARSCWTTVTTFIGVLPMIAERSTAAQFLKPMVVSLGFAVIFALFLTLFMVPALYAIGVDIKRGVMSLWTGEKRPRHRIGLSRRHQRLGHRCGPGQPAGRIDQIHVTGRMQPCALYWIS